VSRWRVPGRTAVEWARMLLVDVVARDPAGALGRGVARFGSWRSLAAITETDWLPLPRRASDSALRIARQGLRRLGSQPMSFAAAVRATGELVHLRGICTALPDDRAPGDELWRAEAVEADGERWIEETGRDFVLRGTDGVAVVLAAEGRLVNAERLQAGDEVVVFGLGDETPDAAGLAGGAPGRGGMILALRSGPRHPLLVSVIRRYDQEDHHGPQD
jgi:hypothetical protein